MTAAVIDARAMFEERRKNTPLPHLCMGCFGARADETRPFEGHGVRGVVEFCEACGCLLDFMESELKEAGELALRLDAFQVVVAEMPSGSWDDAGLVELYRDAIHRLPGPLGPLEEVSADEVRPKKKRATKKKAQAKPEIPDEAA